MKSHKSKREVPLHPDLKNELLQLPRNIDQKALVIDNFISSQSLCYLYKKLGYQITPHSLRHSYATMAIQNGIDFKTVSMLLGDTLDMVMKTYSHVNVDMMDNAQKVLTNL